MKRLVYGVVCLWSLCLLPSVAFSQEYVPQFGHTLEVQALATSPDGKWIASGDAEGRVLLWQADNGMMFRELTPRVGATKDPILLDPKIVPEPEEFFEVVGGRESGITHLAFLRDGTALIAGDFGGRVGILPLDGSAPRAGNGAANPLAGLHVTAANGAVTVDKHTLAWGAEAVEGNPVGKCTRDDVVYVASALSPDGTQLALGLEDGSALLWTVGACEAQNYKALPIPAGSRVRSLAFLTSGQGVVIAHENGRVEILDFATPESIRRIESTARGPLTLAASPDGKSVAVGYEDGKLRRFSLESGLQMDSVDPGTGAMTGVAFVPTTGDLLGATGLGTLYRWSVAEKLGTGIQLGVANAAAYFSMFSPDGKRVIVFPRNSSVEGTVPLHNWNLATMKVSKTPEMPADMLIWGRWTGTGERLFFRENSGGHIVWDMANNFQVLSWGLDYGQRTIHALTPDGKRCLVGEERSLGLYTTKQNSDAPLKTADVTDWVNYADFSADGSRVLTGSDAGIILWEGTKLKRLWGSDEANVVWPHGSQLMAMDLADSGLKAATCGLEGTVALWDLKAKSVTAKLSPSGYACWSVSFAANDKKLLVGTTDGRVMVWDLEKKSISKPVHLGFGIIDDMTISSDGKQLRVATIDGTIYVVDPETGARIHTIYRNEVGEWLVVGANGVLDASPKGKSLLGIREGNTVKPLP